MACADDSHVPLFVDMDGTLLKTDIAQELLLQSFKSKYQIAQLGKLALSGRSHVKRFLAEHNEFSPENLPYNEEVLAYLRAEKSSGRKIILATASDSLIAEKVATYLNIFDDVIASSPGENLKGDKKLQAIESASNGAFEYLGDASADIPIWDGATRCGFVNSPASINTMPRYADKTSFTLANKPAVWRTLLKAMRPHQWAKNTLVFVPLIFSHSYTDPHLVFLALATFFVFSFCASAIYIINDLLDIESDRKHSKKCRRPFAAGLMMPIQGVMASGILLCLPLLFCAFFLSFELTLVILIYILLTNLYSFYLKHYSTIDVITLTCLYTIRIIGGAVAISSALSPWLLNFSLFFFLSLAYMKRYIELSGKKSGEKLSGRNYDVQEMDVILTTGIVNGGLAVLTLSMYLNSDFVTETYQSPQVLWMICPILLFWVYRAWMWAKREKIDDDPVVFALKDSISLATVLVVGLLIIVSKFVDVAVLLS